MEASEQDVSPAALAAASIADAENGISRLIPTRDVEEDGVSPDAVDFHKERLRLARHVLIGLAVIFVFVMVGYVWVSARSHGAEAAKEVFDFVKISFPPIVTLILGAYFKGKSD